MPIRFHRSIKVFPGVRLNFSKRGIGTSIGVKGFHISNGPNGRRVTTSIPGTGISFYQASTKSNKFQNERQPKPVPPPLVPQGQNKKKITAWGWIGIIFGGLTAISFLCTASDSVFHFLPTSTPTVPVTATFTIVPTRTLTKTPLPTATLTALPSETPTKVIQSTKPPSVCDCSFNYDCKDFSSHAAAQSCFVSCGGSTGYNFAHLDGNDSDGNVCESLP